MKAAKDQGVTWDVTKWWVKGKVGVNKVVWIPNPVPQEFNNALNLWCLSGFGVWYGVHGEWVFEMPGHGKGHYQGVYKWGVGFTHKHGSISLSPAPWWGSGIVNNPTPPCMEKSVTYVPFFFATSVHSPHPLLWRASTICSKKNTRKTRLVEGLGGGEKFGG